MLAKLVGNSAVASAAVKFKSIVGVAGASAALTLDKLSGGRIVVTRIIWSYSAAPTGGALTATGEGDSMTFDITAAGPGSLPCMYVGAVNTDVVVTLAAPGGAVVGKLNVEYFYDR